jgi:hypothetical protein
MTIVDESDHIGKISQCPTNTWIAFSEEEEPSLTLHIF